MYELTYSRSRAAYILVTDDVDWSDEDGDVVPMCIIHAETEDEALRTARSFAAGQPVEVARPVRRKRA